MLPEDITHDQKVELLQRGRAFVCPIRWEEPFGLVMIEALACGMPVLATPCGAATEIVEDGVSGYLHHHPYSLAARLESIDDISPRACRDRVEQCFSADAMLDPYEQLFNTLTEQAR
jgi:glycosyltransferase involved in cell wall biosynthesis